MNASSEPIDPRQFRNALGRFATGVTVVTAHLEDATHGMTANAFLSVSLDPPLVLVSVNNRARMHKILPLTGRFGVSFLTEDQEGLSNYFSGVASGGLPVAFIHKHGIPLLDGALAHLVVRLVEAHSAGDHTLFIGQVEYLDWREGRPLLFYSGQYRQISTARPSPAPWPEDDFLLFSLSNFISDND